MKVRQLAAGPVARGAIVSAAVRAAGMGLVFVQVVLAARLLGPEGYGVVAVAMAIVLVVSTLAVLRLEQLAVREVAPLAARQDWAMLRGAANRDDIARGDLQMEASTGFGYRLYPKHDRRVRGLVPNAQVLTAISASSEMAFLELGAMPDRVHRIPNGVDAQRIAMRRTDVAAVRRRLDMPPAASLILSVGRNQRVKGFQFIPDILARLIEKGHELVWAVVGLRSNELPSLAKERGVESHLRLLRPVRNQPGEAPEFPPGTCWTCINQRMSSPFHHSWSPSIWCLSRQWGLACRWWQTMCPGCATSWPTGLTACSAGQPTRIRGADAISSVIRDRALRERPSAEGREKARAQDWSSIAARSLDLYREVLAEAGR